MLNSDYRLNKKILKLPILILTLGVGLALSIYFHQQQQTRLRVDAQLDFEAYRVATMVKQKIQLNIDLLEWQAAEVQNLSEHSVSNWRNGAQLLLNDFRDIKAIQWQRPGSTEVIIEPRSLSSKAIKLSAIEDESLSEWLNDINANSRFMFQLTTDDNTTTTPQVYLLTRVKHGSHRDGILIAHVDFQYLLSQTINQEVSEGFQLQITITPENTEVFAWYGVYDAQPEFLATAEVAMPALPLLIRVWPTESMLHDLQSDLSSTIALTITLSGLLCAMLVYFTKLSRATAQKLTSANQHLQQEMIEREKVEQKLTDMLEYDVLTGFYNRRGFEREFNNKIGDANFDSEYLAIFFIDLDNFREINDTLGHAIGDELIVAVANCIRAVMPSNSIAAHIGADVFVVGVWDVHNRANIEAIARQLSGHIEQPVVVSDYELHTSASLGIAISPEAGMSVNELMRNADITLQRTKQQGRGQFRVFSQDLKVELSKRLTLSKNLRDALRNEEIQLYYQPKVNLVTRKIIGFEALVRWITAEGKVIPPDEFIPIAEDSGLILPLGSLVLEHACEQLSKWHSIGFNELHMAVNVSAKQLLSPNLLEQVVALKKQYQIQDNLLELELTEQTLIDNTSSHIDFMNHAKAEGIAIAIDDFGVGYSSLSYLKHFPVNNLKIDRSFVRDVPQDKDDVIIIRAIIAMAENLGLETVAEGIETDAQCRFLVSEGCKIGQGYLFGKPVPASEATRLLLQFQGNTPPNINKVDQF